MSRSRKVATVLMILSMVFALVGCGGTSGGDEPQTEPETQEATQEAQEEPSDGESSSDLQEPSGERSSEMLIAWVSGEAEEDVALVSGEWGCTKTKSVDALANALINGEVDLAIVTPEVSSALYNATAGSIMAIDAIANEGEAPHAVTVVRLPYFGSNPDDVVAYVARHQEIAEAALDTGTFLRGSAMQRELSAAISDAYVEDPSSIGGTLPPDNFYFLG